MYFIHHQVVRTVYTFPRLNMNTEHQFADVQSASNVSLLLH